MVEADNAGDSTTNGDVVDMEQRSNDRWRSRWAAVGAAIAVALGAGGLLTASAAGPASVFVAIEPTRVLDTRFDVGLAGPFVSKNAQELHVTGTIPIALDGGQSTTAAPVPDGATAIVANVTAIAPGAVGHVSVRPGGATGIPSTANININAPGGVWPNAVTVGVGGNGAINLFYFAAVDAASTEMVVDIVGYYVEGQGAPGPPGPPGPKGDRGERGWSAWDTIPSGVTVTGNFHYDDTITTPGSIDTILVDLPARAPVALDNAHVNFAWSSTFDYDPTCTGAYQTPTAPAGKVCLYWAGYGGYLDKGYLRGNAASALRDAGFEVVIRSLTSNYVVPGQNLSLEGSWAYTAP